MITKIGIDRSYIFTPAIHVVFRAEISGCPSIDSLKEAIRYAVKKYEILNCRILQDESGECFYVQKEIPTEPYIEVRNYHQDSQEFINEQERIRFDLQKGDLQRYIIANDGEKMVLNIVQHHLAGDGKSILILLEEIMNNVQKLEEHEEIIINKEDIVPVKVFTKKYLEKSVELNPLLKMSIEDLNKKWMKEGKVFTLDDLNDMFDQYWEERKTNVATATISGDVLKNTMSICKEHGVTINNLLLTLAAKSMEEKRKMSIVVDLRTPEFPGLGNYASCIMIDALYDENLSIWENALHIQNLVACQKVDKMPLLLGLLFKGTFESGLQDAVYFQGMNMFHSSIVDEFNDLAGFGTEGIPFCISNLGKSALKEDYGKFGIEELSFFSPLSPGLDSNMGVVTVNGNMVLNMMYNETNIDFNSVFDDMVYELENLAEDRSEEYYDMFAYAIV